MKIKGWTVGAQLTPSSSELYLDFPESDVYSLSVDLLNILNTKLGIHMYIYFEELCKLFIWHPWKNHKMLKFDYLSILINDFINYIYM